MCYKITSFSSLNNFFEPFHENIPLKMFQKLDENSDTDFCLILLRKNREEHEDSIFRKYDITEYMNKTLLIIPLQADIE